MNEPETPTNGNGRTGGTVIERTAGAAPEADPTTATSLAGGGTGR